MTRTSSIILALAGFALALGGPSVAIAQDAGVDAALASGAVGEQADGYLGFARPPSPEIKAQVDAINIKRREAYTRIAQTKNVPIEAFAASIGCTTLAAIKPGRSYSIAKGVWATKGAAPVTLPAQCGS